MRKARGIAIVHALALALLPLRIDMVTPSCGDIIKSSASTHDQAQRLLAQSCALERVGLHDDAMETLKKAIKVDPSAQIPENLAVLLGMQQARLLVEHDRLDEARTTLLKRTGPGQACVEKAPSDLVFLCDPFQKAKGLRAKGLLDEAARSITETVDKYPSAPVPPELQFMVGKREDYWRVQSRWLPTFLDLLVTAAIIVLLIVLLVGLLGRFKWFR
jgi:hypothetical protein